MKDSDKMNRKDRERIKQEEKLKAREARFKEKRHELSKQGYYGETQEAEESWFVMIKSRGLPFLVEEITGKEINKIETANAVLQKFIRYVEKKFDAVWYIGSDILGEEIYERFMFHHGGFMEISLRGKIRAFFAENKIEKFRKAVYYATLKTSNKTNAQRVFHEIKSGQKLISLKGSLEDVGG